MKKISSPRRGPSPLCGEGMAPRVPKFQIAGIAPASLLHAVEKVPDRADEVLEQ
jgi:hypothetical protein